MRWLENRIPPPILVLIFAGAMWLAATLMSEPILEFHWQWILAIIFSISGLLIALQGVLEFSRAKTTINPVKIDAASSLVTSGIFAYTRNPMYLGMALFLTAIAFLLNRIAPFTGPIIFVLFITRFQILPEERIMEKKFGAEYKAYREKARRWI